MRSVAEKVEADLLDKVRDSSVLRPGETPVAVLTAWSDGRGPTVTGAVIVGGVIGGAIGGAVGAVISEHRRKRRDATSPARAPRALALVLTNQRLLLFSALRRGKKELYEEIALERILEVSSEPRIRLGVETGAALTILLREDSSGARTYWVMGHARPGIRFAESLRSALPPS